MPNLSKAYQPNEVEKKIYDRWERSGYFNPDNLPKTKQRKPFVISMPPSNITGELHIGHALGFTIQDILIRYHRMRGRAALWLPGTDHAAIATQVVVDRLLHEQGLDRRQLGRDAFLRRVWQWKEKYGSRINEQTRRMGASADWSRERFTMDSGLTATVQAAFVKLYRDGLIYRGERIVNWCSDCQTAISDLEVDHQETPGKLWFIRYPLVTGQGEIVVATTRPETMLGDTAVAVHPSDRRYTKLIGKSVHLPLTGRQITIIADHRISQGFGTGAVKVTPAHDPLDFDLGQTHHLPSITVIGFDGAMTPAAGREFAGLPAAEARRKIVTGLQAAGWLAKEEDYIHAVGFCSRSNTIIEPLLSRQWFIKTKVLAKTAVAAVRSKKIKIVPARFNQTFFHWMSNIRDWNISRQIWWGHRLPVWYKRRDVSHDHPRVSVASPGPGWVQDEDTLDTWFSSGLWTFSTLGWPKRTKDLRRFHPTDVMETAWDILFFWVARMIMFSLYFLKEVPFKTVYLHGLVLDKNGKKMSKSKGTGIDPLVVSDKYGMDALRLSLIIGNGPGQDFRLFEAKIAGYRNFANKLWNVARYVLAQSRPKGALAVISLADRWIMARLQESIAAVTKSVDRFDFSSAGQCLYAFVWHDFADWYLETSKARKNDGVLYHVLENVLALLHPFMPFITEALWAELRPDQLLMVSDWPKFKKRLVDAASAKKFGRLQATVIALRNIKVRGALTANVAVKYVGDFEAGVLEVLSGLSLVRVSRLTVSAGHREITLGHAQFSLPTTTVERFEEWRDKERKSLAAYIAGLEKKLAAPGFATKAPPEIVALEQEKLAGAKQRMLEL